MKKYFVLTDNIAFKIEMLIIEKYCLCYFKPSASILGAVNTLSWDREELLEIPAGLASKMVIDSSVPQQELENGTVLGQF